MMIKRILLALVLSLVLVGTVSAQEATPEVKCPPGYLRSFFYGQKYFCYRATGGEYKFIFSELLSGNTIVAKGESTDATHIDCPSDDKWAIADVTNVQLCLPRNEEAFYVVTDLENGEASSFIEMQDGIVTDSGLQDSYLTAESVWYEATALIDELPNLQKAHIGVSQGKPLFVTVYWGKSFVAILGDDHLVHYVPLSEDLDQTEDREWMTGLTMYHFWNGEWSHRTMTGKSTYEQREPIEDMPS